MTVSKLKVIALTTFVAACILAVTKWQTDSVIHAQAPSPSMLVPDLAVRTVVSGANQPTSMAFIGPNDFFLLEKPTGRVLRVVNGQIQSVVMQSSISRKAKVS